MGDVQGRNNVLNQAQKYTLNQFNTEFPDADACLEAVKEMRFPGGITTCDKCKVERKHHRVTGRTAYACDYCGSHIYPLAGTIFEKSTTDLKMWFHAMYQMGSTKCGISAKQIQRETGVTYKTAWRMFKQIRSLMSDEISLEGSTVEMDETYTGGQRHGIRKDGKRASGRPPANDPKKRAIVGMVERGGRVVAKATDDVKQATLHGLVKEYVLPETIIYTDEYKGYTGIRYLKDDEGKPMGYQHRRIRHASRVYVCGDVHTNTIEGFWSLIKRGIGGAHHSVSAKFLQSYLDEYAFRYNRRDVPAPMFKQILERVSETAE
jgi:transposase-like protein